VSLQDEVATIRGAAAWCTGEHVSAARVTGPSAYEAIDAVCPRELYIQDGGALHTLFLDEHARPIADVYVCADGDDFLVIGETSGPTIAEYLRTEIPASLSAVVDELTATHELASLSGPYAWEVMSDVLTPEIIGLPYLGFFHHEDIVCLRAGKTGEYGYDLLAPHETMSKLKNRVLDAGAEFDLREAGLAAVESCMLENWFFNVRREGRSGATPLELQLQWRVSYGKSYPGSVELLARRRRGPSRRAVLVLSAEELVTSDAVVLGESAVGEMLAAGSSPTLGGWLGIALVDVGLAHPAITDLAVSRDRSRLPLVTVSAPPINNRSLYVDPQRHSFRSRERDAFPSVRLPISS
jgi:aminomethyltransferase